MNISGDRMCGGAMDMEDESVAGTKIWTMNFSNHSSDDLSFFSVLIT